MERSEIKIGEFYIWDGVCKVKAIQLFTAPGMVLVDLYSPRSGYACGEKENRYRHSRLGVPINALSPLPPVQTPNPRKTS